VCVRAHACVMLTHGHFTSVPDNGGRSSLWHELFPTVMQLSCYGKCDKLGIIQNYQ
jgi:hypothetical protein